MGWNRFGSLLSGLIEHVGDTVTRSFFEKLDNETRVYIYIYTRLKSSPRMERTRRPLSHPVQETCKEKK